MRNIFYFLAAIFAFGTAFYYYQDVTRQSATIQKLVLVGEPGTVFEAGTVLDDAFIEQHVVSQAVPANMADMLAWALDDTPNDRVLLQNRVLKQPLRSGSFLHGMQLLADSETSFAERIAPGNRAFTIEVSNGTAVENFIVPGSRVDVIGIFEVGEDRSGEARRLLENVMVMASGTFDSVGEYQREDRPEYQSVTLQASAAIVEQYFAASANARSLTMVLRNPCEDVSSCVGTATLASLDGG